MKTTEQVKKFNLSVFTENAVGLLNRITIVFTRRHLNIESITASESEIPGVHRYTIVLFCTAEQVRKLALQTEKIVEVLKTVYHEDEAIVYREIALYKIATEKVNAGLEGILHRHHARIIAVDTEFAVIEKSGIHNETQELLAALQPYDVLEFARSGRVAITKPMGKLSVFLEELEDNLNAFNN